MALAWLLLLDSTSFCRRRIPLVADPTKEISADYGVLIPSLGIALRGLFIINPEGVLEQVGG